MITKPDLSISSMETGELGVLHLRRYWSKRLLEVEGRLDQRGRMGRATRNPLRR